MSGCVFNKVDNKEFSLSFNTRYYISSYYSVPIAIRTVKIRCQLLSLTSITYLVLLLYYYVFEMAAFWARERLLPLFVCSVKKCFIQPSQQILFE